MSLLSRLALALCGISGCAVPSGAPVPGDAMPRYEPGETFRFSDGQVQRVREVDADRIIWLTADGTVQTSPRDIFLPPLEGTRQSVPFRRVITDRQGELWPPRPGRTTLFRASLRQGPGGVEVTELWSCVVRPVEVLEIRLGKFDVIPVACDVLRGSGAARQTESLVSYYAPRLRHFARLERHDSGGRATVADLTDILTADAPLAPAALVRRDAALQAALENLPSGRDVGWQEPDGASSGRLRPIRTFKVADGTFCREFEEDTTTAQRFDRNRRMACRRAEGYWVEVEPTV